MRKTQDTKSEKSKANVSSLGKVYAGFMSSREPALKQEREHTEKEGSGRKRGTGQPAK